MGKSPQRLREHAGTLDCKYSGAVGMVMAVSFERYGRLYYLDPGEFRPRVGEKVLVPTDDGPEVAECVWAPQYVTEEVGGLPLCEGIATTADLDRDEQNRTRRADARVIAKRTIRQHGLPMKVVGIDFVDRREDVDQLVIVYFSAPHRVDFRELVRDLARALRARIELRQVGARDEARLQGGIGPCGRDLCCATFLKDFEPVSVRMAKDQDLPLNPLKISGACGRLMCCLKYEHPLYQEYNAKAPALGTAVETPAGDGVVVGHNVPSDTVVVRLAASGRRCACSRADVCSPRQQYEASSTTTPDAPPVEAAVPEDAVPETVAPENAGPETVVLADAVPEAAVPDEAVSEETPGDESREERRARKPRRRRRLHHDDEGEPGQ
ncbi:cell fate regulator YaaT (PSP1 superfamily) [Kribbella kalugense]|uniref:Cell fate regulator YaaT (PSP1 superfamily) n=2 Tax=Kribbella kalugense TaxID=2512221 RepID=A0A4R7ZPU6_9ACTN|nr:cell fate regulator YaaT (PSP1 superfamily) [Kribbella kalugense]